MHVTANDGVNEPALWQVEEVSNKVGTPSAHGVGLAKNGRSSPGRRALLFDGGEPVKISQEIQPTWDAINWQYGHLIWVQVDTQRKRIYVGVPTGLRNASRIGCADARLHTRLRRSARGMLSAPGNSRKWAPWMICREFVRR